MPQLTSLASPGWLSRVPAALRSRDEQLSRSGPSGWLRCGCCVPAELTDPTALPLQASLFKQRVQAKIGEERQRAEGREAALMAQKEEVLGLLASEP